MFSNSIYPPRASHSTNEVLSPLTDFFFIKLLLSYHDNLKLFVINKIYILNNNNMITLYYINLIKIF